MSICSYSLPGLLSLPLPTSFARKPTLIVSTHRVDEHTAAVRYGEYKAGFVKTQLQVFYETHKHTHWLLEHYHPSHITAHRDAIVATANARLAVFTHFFTKGTPDQSDRLLVSGCYACACLDVL